MTAGFPIRTIGQTANGDLTEAWSLIRIAYNDDATMRGALGAGWEPFAAADGDVLLRRHAERPYGSIDPQPLVGRWPFDPSE